jgi:hypothetical protein
MKNDEQQQRRKGSTPSAGDTVYGLGVIGALVWYWQQADGAGDHILGVLKALLWPAFLVHKAFRALDG